MRVAPFVLPAACALAWSCGWGGSGAAAAGSVKGRVVLSDTAGMNDLSRVRVYADPGAAEATPDEDGRFLLEQLAVGNHMVTVVYQGGLTAASSGSAYKRADRIVTIEREKTANMGDINLVPGTGTVSGTVQTEDVAYPIVQLVRDGVIRQGAAAEGRYYLPDVPLGPWSLWAAADNHAIAATAPCSVDIIVDSDGAHITADTPPLVRTDVSFAPGAGEVTTQAGERWTLSGSDVTILVTASFAKEARIYRDGAEAPAFESFDGTLSVSNAPWGESGWKIQLKGCTYESPAHVLTLVRP